MNAASALTDVCNEGSVVFETCDEHTLPMLAELTAC
jgi:hypothetical protein